MLWSKAIGAGGADEVIKNLEYIGHKWGEDSVTVTRGVDYENGDILFSYMVYYSGVLITNEAEWTPINNDIHLTYQSFAFSRIVASASSYTTDNGNYGNTIVVFRPTNYSTLTQVDAAYGLNGATATINMTDTNDSLYIGFGSVLTGTIGDITVPSFANVVDVGGATPETRFYWAYQEAGHGNTGSIDLDVNGTFELCTEMQLDLR
jgi:hypothetical protein